MDRSIPGAIQKKAGCAVVWNHGKSGARRAVGLNSKAGGVPATDCVPKHASGKFH